MSDFLTVIQHLDNRIEKLSHQLLGVPFLAENSPSWWEAVKRERVEWKLVIDSEKRTVSPDTGEPVITFVQDKIDLPDSARAVLTFFQDYLIHKSDEYTKHSYVRGFAKKINRHEVSPKVWDFFTRDLYIVIRCAQDGVIGNPMENVQWCTLFTDESDMYGVNAYRFKCDIQYDPNRNITTLEYDDTYLQQRFLRPNTRIHYEFEGHFRTINSFREMWKRSTMFGRAG